MEGNITRFYDVEIILLSGHKMTLEVIPLEDLEPLFNELLTKPHPFIRIANHNLDIAGFIRNDQIASLIAMPTKHDI